MNNHIDDTEKVLLDIARKFLSELGADALARDITVDIDLERELGIDSIKKAELFHRIEAAYGITLSDDVFSKVATLGNLVSPITDAGPTKSPPTRQVKSLQPKAKFEASSCTSFVEVLHGYAMSDPDRVHVYLQDEAENEVAISYGQLLSRSLQVASSLQAYGIKPHETVAIMLPTCEEFFYMFFGLLLVGAIPVPIYPPFRPDQIEDFVSRSIFILRAAGVRLLITFDRVAVLSKQLKPFIPSLIAVLTVDQLLKRKDHHFKSVDVTDSSPALIQYTSGSTGNPKGVLLFHSNLLDNLCAATTALQLTERDVVVSWLPLYHDMGLIGKWLGSLYYGVPAVIMPPQSFLARPERWLWNIHYHRGTISAAPNFAYSYCVNRIRDQLIEGLNLSSWRVAANGSEAVDPKIFRAFYKRFSNYGLSENALSAVYGLAESTVAVAFSDIDSIQHYDIVDRDALLVNGTATKATKKSKQVLEFACCGKAIPNHEIRVVDEHQVSLPERVVGMLQFKGPSSMQGYYHNASATEEIKHGDWYETGDLAYIADGNLYITGRKKDIIIKAGRNLNPEEIEEVTSQASAVRKGCVIAFGVQSQISGTEELIIVAEIRKSTTRSKEYIRESIIKLISAQLGDPPDKIVLVNPGQVPKTSSGKLRRAQCRQAYLNGQLAGRSAPPWWQLTKIFGKSLFKKLCAWLAIIARIFYTAYVAVLTVITVLPLWLLLLILPKKMSAKFTQITFRMILPLVGMPVVVNNRKLIIKDKPVIFVANHSSYLDSIVLIAYLQPSIAFIAKKEVLKVPVLATFIKRLKHITVQRKDAVEGIASIEQAKQALKSGRPIMIFPEGGISLTPGLRTFKSGAFNLAATTKSRICPLSIKGTRQILRNDHFLLRPGKIYLSAEKSISAKDDSWQEITRLTNMARQAILHNCGEQLLDLSYLSDEEN